MGETKVIPLPFDQGLAQQEAIEWLDSGASASGILNGNFTKQGAVDKRLGMRLASNGTTRTSQGNPYVNAPITGVQAVTWSHCALGAVSQDIYGQAGLYSLQDNGTGLVALGPMPNPRVVRRGLPGAASPANVTTTPSLVDVPDVGGVGIIRFVFHVSGSNTYYSVINADTGDTVLTQQFLYSGTPANITGFYLPNAQPQYQVVVMLSFPGAPGNIVCLTLSTSTFEPNGSPLTEACYGADIAPYQNDPQGGFLLFYQDPTAGFISYYYTGNFTLGFSTTVENGISAQAQYYPCLVAGTYNEHIMFLYEYQPSAGSNNLVRFKSYSGEYFSNPTVGPMTVTSTSNASPLYLSGLLRMAAGTYFVTFWSQVAPAWAETTSIQGSYCTLTAAGSLSAPLGVLPLGALPVAKPFSVSGAIYQPTILTLQFPDTLAQGSTSSEQCTMYLLEFMNVAAGAYYSCQPVATVAPRQIDPSFAYFSTSFTSVAPSYCSATTGTRYALGLKTVSEDVPGVGQVLGAAWSADFRFDYTSQCLNYQSCDVSGAGHISGPVPMVCDGVMTYEDNFFYYPEFLTVYSSGSGTTSLSTGNYFWAVCYKHIDATGQLTRGSPVFTQQAFAATNGGHSPEIFFPQLSMTYRGVINGGQVYAEIYRTLVNGSVFYLEAEVVTDGTGTGISYVSNVPDGTIESSSILYTTGGILDCVNPPSLSCQVVHWNRVWGVDETLRTIWFTKQFTPGETPGWNEALTISFPQADVTALYSMDDKLIIGTLQGLYVVYGFGPADTGQGSDLTEPQPIACDAGPIDWRSGVVFPGGLLYLSRTGFMLCDRSLNVSWIGKDVVDTLALYPNVVSSVLVPTATQVRFICQNAAGTASTVLVYDYLSSKWLQHSYVQQTMPTASSFIANATAQNAASYATLTTDGLLWQENVPGSTYAYMDQDFTYAQHFVPTSVTTAWVKLQGVQGYQRARQVQLYFEEMDDCGITMGFAVNYNSSVVQSHTWPSTVIDKLPNTFVQQHVGAQYMKQAGLQVTISDVAGAAMTNGQGARFVGLSVELESLGSRYRQLPVGGKA